MHLYLHIPFCHKICPYCAFYKHTLAGHNLDAFVDALLAEAQLYQEKFHLTTPVTTIHLGGGTPSLLKSSHFRRLFAGLFEQFSFENNCEISLEANPSTFDLEKCHTWKEIGVTRVSLGVQSFQEKTLQILGRDHSKNDAIQAFTWLKEAEIAQVNLDLMFSLPQQNLSHWEADLTLALQLNPDHISAYNLTWEEDTEFLQKLQDGSYQASPEKDADCFELARTKLTEAGFEHYEVSNYAKQGCRSRHNQAYWRGQDYLGLGPGAVSTWKNKRWKNKADTSSWSTQVLQGNLAQTEHETLSTEARKIEQIALGLRTKEGIPSALVTQKTTLPYLVEAKLIRLSENQLTLTTTGLAIADEIALQLI